MTPENLQQALDITRAAVTEAGHELKQYYGNIETISKGDGDSVGGVVTELDRKTEQFLQRELGKFSTEVGFRGEEFGVTSEADTTWLVDPYGMDWDFAPGSLLVREAGGVATNIGQNTYDYKNHDFIIANPLVHQALTSGDDAIFPMER